MIAVRALRLNEGFEAGPPPEPVGPHRGRGPGQGQDAGRIHHLEPQLHLAAPGAGGFHGNPGHGRREAGMAD